MTRYGQMEAFVLCGGTSSRMGCDKALLEFFGTPLLVRTARLVETSVGRVALVGPRERYGAFGFSTIEDFDCDTPDGVSPGPLAGIAGALSATSAPWNLILACDLPYLSREWLEWLLARTLESDAQIVLPRTSRGLEPLAAVYRRECAVRIIAALEGGARKVTDALAPLRLETVDEREWHSIALEGNVLRNMNTRADYEEAQRWWSR